MIYHVAKNGSDQNCGTQQKPFFTINQAASIAVAGDTIIVHKGVYREWVKPRNKGMSNCRRIIYQAATNEKVVIKGSEVVNDWQQVERGVWKTVLPNSFFQGYNPYELTLFGDWLVTPPYSKHLGDVYLNGMSFYEADTYEDVLHPQQKTEVIDQWTQQTVPVLNPEQTKYVWFASVAQDETTIYANFHNYDPRNELVEINVRRSCFYPTETGIDFITVRGFEMAQAATPWTPPTADQPGLIGANWSKGWIIEHNVIHDAKCSAISIGKEASTGNNYHSLRLDKSGYQYQLESVFAAERIGWKKENIGSHIIRYNTIYDCGQNAIVGHLGCIFSEIHHNHIYNIAVKREFYGYEIAGIKLHAALDVQIHHNRIHHCSLGTWLDWEAQGTRVSQNLYYQNNRDLFVEVSHGPYLVDHNILASVYALDNFSQGGAYINNLIAGKMSLCNVMNRSTPYHVPHSTLVAGFSIIYGGDDRFINNIFIGNPTMQGVGTSHYNGSPTSLSEYISTVRTQYGDVEEYQKVKQPAYISNNIYFHGATPFDREQNPILFTDHNPEFKIIEKEDEVYLSCDMPKEFSDYYSTIASTATLPKVRLVDADYENPDGHELVLDTDYLDDKATHNSPLGPITKISSEKNMIKIW